MRHRSFRLQALLCGATHLPTFNSQPRSRCEWCTCECVFRTCEITSPRYSLSERSLAALSRRRRYPLLQRIGEPSISLPEGSPQSLMSALGRERTQTAMSARGGNAEQPHLPTHRLIRSNDRLDPGRSFVGGQNGHEGRRGNFHDCNALSDR
jgi:hypothetical protein